MSSADALTCLAFSPDSQKVASGSARLGVTVTHITSQSKRQLEMSAVAHTPAIVAWSPDGEKIMSASLDNTLRCWDAISSDPLGPAFQGHKELILAASFLRDSSHAISLSKDGELLMWDTGSGKITRQETVSKHARTIFVAALSMDGTLLITSDQKECVAWDIPACMQIAAITLPDVPLLQAAIIPNSHHQVVLAFGNMSFWIWDTTTRNHDDARFEGLDRDAISCAMAVSPDGGLLVLEIDGVDDEYPTHFYNRKGQEFPKPNIRCIHPFAFSPDGERFAASHVRSDSKDDSHKLVIRTVEEIRGYKSRDVRSSFYGSLVKTMTRWYSTGPCDDRCGR
ncbi:WD40 repeat-like protein [Rhizopogon vinicolor AM-OR11-026]|uniref:WD40 repeat-like protein n=1 Tax=Rhizopogon vinicolor AM-OR11-026 TaxID=1314800 RepID=A0A1B7MZ19_9AGAM|nr:WD40 repeat-like protein [Rhizopogon vinicolor AM-OR11-026]